MAEIRAGKSDVSPDAPSHVRGIKQGNSTGNYARQEGHLPNGRCTAERSTGVNAKGRQPIDKRMPNLPPA